MYFHETVRTLTKLTETEKLTWGLLESTDVSAHLEKTTNLTLDCVYHVSYKDGVFYLCSFANGSTFALAAKPPVESELYIFDIETTTQRQLRYLFDLIRIKTDKEDLAIESFLREVIYSKH